jgi:drug/metabolite transporter (DMT)-like permease
MNERDTLNPTPQKVVDWIGWMHLLIVCVIGGSTFLAIRMAVGPGSGFPPLWMAASRFTTAGGLLLAGLTLSGGTVTMPLHRLAAVLASGMLLWGGGNGLASVASQKAGSGLVAIFFAIGPLWVAAIEGVLDRRRPSLRSLAGMVLGAGGVVLLVLPKTAALPADPTTVVALLLAPASYAGGVVVLRRAGSKAGVLTTAGWQMLGGAGALWVAVAVRGGPAPAPTPTAWGAWAYLILVGSVIGFTSFTAALRRMPTPVFMSHAWINPIVATALGAAVLGESLSGYAVIASVSILVGLVTIVTSPTKAPQSSGEGAGTGGNGTGGVPPSTMSEPRPSMNGSVASNGVPAAKRPTLGEAIRIAFFGLEHLRCTEGMNEGRHRTPRW